MKTGFLLSVSIRVHPWLEHIGCGLAALRSISFLHTCYYWQWPLRYALGIIVATSLVAVTLAPTVRWQGKLRPQLGATPHRQMRC